MIRPEVAASLRKWSEVLLGLGVASVGLWALQAHGSFYKGIAALIIVTGLALAVIGWRRMRFRRNGDGPGIVQVLEGQISFFGPETGGFIGQRDIVEVHLLQSGSTWRLIDASGNDLSIPLSAGGTQALYDVFASLPGIDMPTLLAAMDAPGPDRCLWVHPARRAKWRSLA